MRPARYFSIIQLSNSRDEKVMKEVKSISEEMTAESSKVRQEFMKRRYRPPGT